jgi:predicted transcriptional regulator
MFRLKDFRQAHGIFQSKMAEILGTTQSSISRMESENIELTIDQYQKLYDTFGQESVDTYRVEDDSILVSGGTNGKLNSDLVEIIKKQNEMVCENMKKISDLNERLMSLLEKLALK